jgi:DNA-binding CsgD family transcriptional regulator
VSGIVVCTRNTYFSAGGLRGVAVYVPLAGLRHAVRLVESLTDLDNPEAFAGLALPGLARLIGCDSLSFTVVGAEPGQVSVTRYPDGTSPLASTAAFAAFVHEHPSVNYHRETGEAGPVMISDFLGRQDFHRLNLYSEYFRGIPVEYQIAFGLPSTSPEIIGIALNRAARDFTEYERDLLSVIHFPLATALRRARQRQCARGAVSGALADLTDREVRVLRLAALGRTNIAIAHTLDISPRTVAKHLEHIYRKLDVNSRTSAVFAALTDRT